MFLRKEFEKRIEKKREEIATLEKQLAEARAYLMALEDSMKILSRAGDSEGGEAVLRPGTDLARARDFLRKAGKAMHVTKIIEGLGKEANKENRVSLSGSLSNYVRKGLIFSRPAPNTFGLVEFGETDGTEDNEPPSDPPEGFGEEEDTDEAESAGAAVAPLAAKPVPSRPVPPPPARPTPPPTKPAPPSAPAVEEDDVPF